MGFKIMDLILLTKYVLRVIFVIANNIYCIPTYLIWVYVLLWPVRLTQPSLYWYIEGILFKWLLMMVAAWSWGAGYFIIECGDDIQPCWNQRCLVLANHQSTADVPTLMGAFQNKGSVLANVLWIMDRLFRFTNFGCVSLAHQDYFITQGKEVRDTQLQKLRRHLLNVYVPLGRQWIVLFPEGGFLRKRRETSNRYAEKYGYPVLNHVTLPRVGAMQVILDTLRPGKIEGTGGEQQPLTWVIDATIGYPAGDPLDLLTICSGSSPSRKTYVHYRRFPAESLPTDEEALKLWLYRRWEEKEEMLEEFYTTGKFPDMPRSSRSNSHHHEHSKLCSRPVRVEFSNLWIAFLHVFFICSSCFHMYLLWGVLCFF